MNVRDQLPAILLAASILLVPFGVVRGQTSPAAAPNVILIVLDDFGWADLACYGSRFHRTPNIDRLANTGMRFTDAYAACCVCSPTRAALLTGKSPARLHLTDWLPGRSDRPSQKLKRPEIRQQLPLEERTLAEALAARGYVCASIGKWHLGGEGFGPLDQGFTLQVGGDAAGTPLSYFAPFQRGERFMPGLREAPKGEYLTDRLTSEAEAFIRQNASRPFFLYLPHFAVHIPLQAELDLVEKYGGMPPANRVPTGKQENPVYAAMIESVDQGVGRIVDQLKAAKIDDRTVILFTSDNGGLVTLEGNFTPATSNSPLREGKGYLYEGGLRVPLIVNYPPLVPAGTTSSTPVGSIDIFPTVLELCGGRAVGVDGVSLVPVLKQAGNLERQTLYWHYPHYSNQGGRPGGAIREGRYKLIEYYEDQRRELFDLQEDVRENNNLVEKLPDVAERLSAQLASWRRDSGAQSMTPNPDYVPNPQGSDGVVLLPASAADVHGLMLRFEPQPHKNTLGFWVRTDDWASWEFQLERPGEYRVVVEQGCGNGSGGSEVAVQVDEQELRWVVEETGGFQSFVLRDVGTIKLDRAGRQQLTIKPVSKPGVAVMDVRSVRLVPQKVNK